LSARYLSPKRPFIPPREPSFSAQIAIICACLAFFFLLISGGCSKPAKEAESTPTSGSLAVLAAPAIAPVVQAGADAFNRLYSKANVNVYPLDSRAIVDSMIYRRTDIGYFDRNLSEAESLAIVQSRRHVYRFHLGSTIATWIVHPSNDVSELDSLQILDILTGKITNWHDVGGSHDDIDIFLPPLGDGAWIALKESFSDALAEVEAHYWPSDSAVVAQVANDPAGLGFVGRAIYDKRIKRIRWRDPLLADAVPANIGALQEGKYPFRVRLCYYTIADKTDLASGFLSFLASNAGQRMIADNGFLPEMIPVRIVNLSPSGDQK
jgi:phosphate transport system substrate-binding protein